MKSLLKIGKKFMTMMMVLVVLSGGIIAVYADNVPKGGSMKIYRGSTYTRGTVAYQKTNGRTTAGVYNNNLIIEKGIENQELLEKSELSEDLLFALRDGRKKCTKDLCLRLALAMKLTQREFLKFADKLKLDFDTDRDALILSNMNNLLQIQNMPEHKGKTVVEIINIILKKSGMKPLANGTGKIRHKSGNLKTVFITGGFGFIGRNCIEYFTKLSLDPEHPFKYKICVLSTTNANNENIPKNIIYYHGRLNDSLLYERILLENSVDYIIHLAAIPIPANAGKNQGTTIDVNAQAVNTLCNTILQNHIPVKGFIFPSTEHVYQGKADSLKEDSLIDPSGINSTYAYSKYIAENIVRNYAKEGVPVIIARLSNIYGKYDKHIAERVIPKTINCLLNGKAPELYIDKDTGKSACIDFLYVEDLVRAFHTILEAFENPQISYNPKDIIYNLGSGTGVYVKDIQELIMKVMNKDMELKEVKCSISDRAVMDVEKIRQKFRIPAGTDLETALRKTIDWYIKSTQQA